MWAKIITIKRTKDLNYFSLCALNLFNTRDSQFELNYWNKITFPQHSNFLKCTFSIRNIVMWHLQLVFQTYFCQQRAKAPLILYNVFLDILFEFSRYQLSFPTQVLFLMQVLALRQQNTVNTCFCVGDAKLYYYRHYALTWHQGRTPTLVRKWIWKQKKKVNLQIAYDMRAHHY